METSVLQRFLFFSDLIACGQPLYSWELDPSLQVVYSNCPNQELLYSLLALDGSMDLIGQYMAHKETAPLVLSNEIALSWIAAFEQAEGIYHRVYLVGPVYNSDVSVSALEQALMKKRFPREVITNLSTSMQELPVIPYASWAHYALMLHYAVTGERIEYSDLHYPPEIPTTEFSAEDTTCLPKNSTWLAEQAAMQMITKGQLDYKKGFSRLLNATSYANGTDLTTSLWKMKAYVISFITLCTRAAIAGGMRPETAYYLGEKYIDDAATANSLAEFSRINVTAYEDFIKRVHKLHAAQGRSQAIRDCCDYIDQHLSEKITISQLAQATGYSESHLTRKFKKEMNCTLSSFVQTQRIEHAKRLLRSGNQPIQEIGESLGFCNTSYFCSVFQEFTGKTPKEYRDEI